ncbi:MAG: aldo/keto reductase [Clostridiales Family XIII bacterium]|nr:aldo/keto reductase [Clostridiales Family XIII bacterium]
MIYKDFLEGRSVSAVGLGGHYTAWDTGRYEYRTGYIDPDEIPRRTKWIEKALDAGINFFDTTWRSEVEMFSKSILPLAGRRDEMIVNSMVLGAFTGPNYFNRDLIEYFEEGIDWRLKQIPGGYFDTFMVNCVEEEYEEKGFEKLIRLLETRKARGDIGAIGISSHIPYFARKLANQFPELEVILIPYSFHNRALERAFADYTGNAKLIAMKSLVWDKYGVPFCTLNDLPDPKISLGIEPVRDIVSHAISWVIQNPKLAVCITSVNAETELDELIHATEISPDIESLTAYKDALIADRGLIYNLSSLNADPKNSRAQFFALKIAAGKLGVPYPFNETTSLDEYKFGQEDFDALREAIYERIETLGLGRYLKK